MPRRVRFELVEVGWGGYRSVIGVGQGEGVLTGFA